MKSIRPDEDNGVVWCPLELAGQCPFQFLQLLCLTLPACVRVRDFSRLVSCVFRVDVHHKNDTFCQKYRVCLSLFPAAVSGLMDVGATANCVILMLMRCGFGVRRTCSEYFD
jgi:hypothetical protein